MSDDPTSGGGMVPEFTSREDDLTSDAETPNPTDTARPEIVHGRSGLLRYRLGRLRRYLRPNPDREPRVSDEDSLADNPVESHPTQLGNVRVFRQVMPEDPRPIPRAGIRMLLKIRQHIEVLVHATGGSHLERVIGNAVILIVLFGALTVLYLLRPGSNNLILSIVLWAAIAGTTALLGCRCLLAPPKRPRNRTTRKGRRRGDR